MPKMTQAIPSTYTKLRILQVSSANGGGIDAMAGELASHLPANGVSLVWMAGGPVDSDTQSLPDLHIERRAVWDPLERRMGMPFPLWSLQSLALMWNRIGASDAVHIHDFLYVPSLIALLFSSLRRRPVVITQHIGEIRYKSTFARCLLAGLNRSLGALVLGSVSQVVFVGQPVKRYFEQFVRFRHPPHLVSNGVDHSRFHPSLTSEAKERSIDRSPKNPVRLLFVGRFVEKKGLPLLRGCIDLPGVQWTFVGDGPIPPPEHPQVEMTGSLQPDDVAARYRAADLLVLPSTGEGFPLVVQEALACGIPVLVSTEVFEAFPQVDERCVFHVELRACDADQASLLLRQRLQALIADIQTLSAARSAAIELSKQWNWDATARSYSKIYRQAALGVV